MENFNPFSLIFRFIFGLALRSNISPRRVISRPKSSWSQTHNDVSINPEPTCLWMWILLHIKLQRGALGFPPVGWVRQIPFRFTLGLTVLYATLKCYNLLGRTLLFLSDANGVNVRWQMLAKRAWNNIWVPLFLQDLFLYLKGPETPRRPDHITRRKVKHESFPTFLSQSLNQ